MEDYKRDIGKKVKLTPQEYATPSRAKFSVNDAQERNRQRRAYKSGFALRNHQEACHSGNFDSLCPACKELKKKLDF